MHVENYFDNWKREFDAAGYTSDVARSEFDEWVAGLDGELNNDYTQNPLSVSAAAENAIWLLQQDEWAQISYADENCPKCGRQRLEKCANGKHWCEKCNWVVEDGKFFRPGWRN
ncbi:hypothetical protein [Pseudoalteromonas ruthenica]|uniref:hypothetical protein n=1 Tax=Pseudoalteromonas ruthenica TaxID=151081 RepID=UPI00110BA057|nr:hypothetical protein [Pseudoalteromonas ruthenica]TMP20846.1 hypothetical protein CWC06_19495 [Pseudoalteromonas ruthenica]